MQQFLALQTGGRRALRFDMGTDCGPQYVDIQDVRAAGHRSTTSPASDDQNFYRVRRDVADALGSAGPRDVFVLADGPTDAIDGGESPRSIPDDRADAANITMRGPHGLDADPPGHRPAPRLAANRDAARDHPQPRRRPAVRHAPHLRLALLDGHDVMCYPDGTPEAAGYNPEVRP